MRNWTKEEYESKVGIRPAAPPMSIGSVEDDSPKMNKTEAAFALHLDLQKKAGKIRNWWFESMKFRIGKHCWLLIDFLVETNEGKLIGYDTKGTKKLESGRTAALAEDDSAAKCHALADKYPIPTFFVWKERNGEWSRRRM